MLHVDRFISTVTEKGRSKVIEDINPDFKTIEVVDAISYSPARANFYRKKFFRRSKLQLDPREPLCPSCDAILEKTGETQKESSVLLELACNDCQKKYVKTHVKNFEAENTRE